MIKKHKYNKGDLVVSNLTKVFPEDKSWYGFVLEVHPDAPKTYPLYAAKYKIQWMGGEASWHFAPDIKLVCRANR